MCVCICVYVCVCVCVCVCVDVHVCNHVLYIAEVGNKRTDLHQNKWAQPKMKLLPVKHEQKIIVNKHGQSELLHLTKQIGSG